MIIHESRFTYEKKGLAKVIDLGEWWEKKTGLPVPLGCIAMNNSFPEDVREKVNRIIRRSVEFAFAHPDSSKDFVKQHAQEMEDEVIQKHVHLYVNEFSLKLGEEGKKAINALLGLS